jgi:glucosyl-3-phosphoglycerate synthase
MVRDDVDVAPSTSVAVVIAARNEAATVVDVVAAALDATDEVIVVDDGSTDDTARIALEAGATVVPADAGPGKGQAMRTGVEATTADVVVFCDADLRGVDRTWFERLAKPLLDDPALALVKAAYLREGEGGRVNELVARPLLDLLFPSVAHLRQPLGGEYAVRRLALDKVTLENGYGVDLALVLDIADLFGPDSITEVDLGVRVHRNRPLPELVPQAREVLEVALRRM